LRLAFGPPTKMIQSERFCETRTLIVAGWTKIDPNHHGVADRVMIPDDGAFVLIWWCELGAWSDVEEDDFHNDDEEDFLGDDDDDDAGLFLTTMTRKTFLTRVLGLRRPRGEGPWTTNNETLWYYWRRQRKMLRASAADPFGRASDAGWITRLPTCVGAGRMN
jgi:hypothetical protein